MRSVPIHYAYINPPKTVFAGREKHCFSSQTLHVMGGSHRRLLVLKEAGGHAK